VFGMGAEDSVRTKYDRINNNLLRKLISCTDISRQLKFGQWSNQITLVFKAVDCLEWNSKTRMT